ncbi:MAG TPA: hypothetical protein VLC95_12365 [Anaerolineae bacterium]|nr:hypothetical protein [Anaerolineae bacterium]
MRWPRSLQLLLVVLLFAACAEKAAPMPVATSLATATPVTGSRMASIPTEVTKRTSTSTAAPTRRTEPTRRPASPTATRVARVDRAWPRPLAALDLGVPAGNSYGPRAVVIHPDLRRLYVRTRPPVAYGNEPGTITVIDLETEQVLDVVATGPDGYADGDLIIDSVRDRVYALNPGDTTATVLDAGTLETVRTIEGVDRLAVDEDAGTVYIAGPVSLRALDAETLTLAGDRALEASRSLALEVDPAGGRLYLTHEQMGGGYALTVFDAATLDRLTTVALPGGPDDLVVAADRQQVFVTFNDGEHNLLWVLDADGSVLEESTLGEWTQHTYLALDAAGGRLFLSQDAYNKEGVLVRDLGTGRMERLVDLEHAPGRLAWDPTGGRLFASLTYADRLAAIDPRTGEVSGVLPTAVTLVDVEVDPERGHLLITDSAGRLHVLESDGSREVALLEGEGEIAVDGRNGRYYTGGGGARQVRIVDADALELTGTIDTRAVPVADPYHDDTLYLVRNGVYVASLETLTITMAISDTLPQSPGFSPNPAAVGALVDPDSGQLLVLINNGIPGSNNGNYLHVYEPDSYERIFEDFERSPVYLDVDPTSDRAYVARIRMDKRSVSQLVNGREYADRIDGLFGPLYVDPGLGLVYLSTTDENEGHLVLIDGANLNVVGSVPIAGGFSLRALDTSRHLLYLATRDGQLEIWAATGGDRPEDAPPVRAPLSVDPGARLHVAPGTDSVLAGSLYRSDDEGRTWHFLGTGLPAGGVGHLAVSPAFDDDGTLFAAQAVGSRGNLGVWKSDTGGRTWRMANNGLDDLSIVDLAISPAFPGDGTLFALTRDQGLFRSTDGGEAWEPLADRYLPADAGSDSPRLIAISPTYRDDQTLYVAHQGLHRATDGGETWTQVVDTGAEALALAPDYATSHTLYGWFGHAGLLRSGDGGDNWQPVSAGLLIEGYGVPRLFLPASSIGGNTVYFLWETHTPGERPQIWRSTDAGETWQRLVGAVPEPLTRLELAPDGAAFVGLDEMGRVRRWPVADMAWEVPALPPLAEIQFDRIALPPNFRGDVETASTQRVLYGVSQMAGVLFSPDAGLTWTATGYPHRHLFGALDALLALPSGEALAATQMGLYRYDPARGWAVVEGGLPAGGAVTGLERGEDGALRLLGEKGEELSIYMSVDEGHTWTEPLPPLPVPAVADDWIFSPAFSTDRTAFLAVSQGRPLRSRGGGAWEEVGPPGDWYLSALDVSPALDQDGLVLMRTDTNVLWRSLDLGDTWQQIGGAWPADVAPTGIAQGSGYRLPALTFSPDFGTDRVALTRAGGTLYRSADGGETWTAVLTLAPGMVHTAFSPAYEADGVIYLVQGETVYRSADRGASWQELPGAAWSAFEEMQIEISPTFARARTLLAWNLGGLVYLSDDAGGSWRAASAGLPPNGLRQVTFSPAHADDGLIYAAPYQGGIYRYAGDGAWVLATQATGRPRAAPAPTATPPRPPAVAPTLAPTPQCEVTPERFADLWQVQAARLGCPVEPERQLTLAVQAFEHGLMIWDSEERAIYVLLDGGTWQALEDRWQEGVDPAYDPDLPPPPRQPQRGFGKVWREALGGPDAQIGWAVEVERAVAGWQQGFERGRLYWTDMAGGTVFLLYDDGSWQSIK